MVAAVAWAAWAIWICDAATQPRRPGSLYRFAVVTKILFKAATPYGGQYAIFGAVLALWAPQTPLTPVKQRFRSAAWIGCNHALPHGTCRENCPGRTINPAAAS